MADMRERERLWTVDEVAKHARVSAEHVRRLCRSGKISADFVSRHWLIAESEVNRWVRAHRAAQYDRNPWAGMEANGNDD